MSPDPDAGRLSGCDGCLDRRSLLRGAAVSGAGVLAAATAAPAGAAEVVTWRVLCRASDVPFRDGIFVQVSKGFTVVVTRPRRALLRCFSARCTHQGCICNAVRGRRIHCPCHGSQYGLRTGAVLA
ncbi:MAG: Rieske (2Fe-2S) protein, partial [Actinomycetota bacterium]|nr:Rieske (2Fe-2S) protein [Actinomycetota bacterium]